jgi:hypothetical protein
MGENKHVERARYLRGCPESRQDEVMRKDNSSLNQQADHNNNNNNNLLNHHETKLVPPAPFFVLGPNSACKQHKLSKLTADRCRASMVAFGRELSLSGRTQYRTELE